ncbi:MAG TPA: class I SAM-dependent methyltransferase [Thermoplasmata archaeon]
MTSYLGELSDAKSVGGAVRKTGAHAMQALLRAKLAIFCRGSTTPGRFDDRWAFMEYAVRQATVAGEWCEFGMFRGESLRFIAARATATVHAFDTFEGLPATWGVLDRGAFSTRGQRPDVPPNVVLHVGLFDATVPPFVEATRPAPIAFAHVDCDLYDSAASVLREIRPLLVPGSIVVFDELLGVFHNDEYSALVDEILSNGIRIQWLGFCFYPDWGSVPACEY